MPHVLERIEKARAEGLDVAANQYPWTAAENGLDANLPEWVREGGSDKLLSRLRDSGSTETCPRRHASRNRQMGKSVISAPEAQPA